MTPSHDLFRLVKSLTRSEKGYFRKYTARHVMGEENTYITLFNAIDRQESYDEGKIREEFRDTTFIRRLPALKNYLYALILRSLRSYNVEASPSRQLRGLLDDYTTLADRDLYDQAHKVLGRARALAEKYDLNYYKPIIEGYTRKLQTAQFMSGTSTERMEESLARERTALEQLLRFNGLETINKRLFKHISEQGTRGADPAGLQALISDPLLPDAETLQWPASRFIFYQIRSTAAYYIGDYRESRRYILEALHLLEEHAQYAAKYRHVAASLLQNLVGICALLCLPDEAKTHIEHLRSLPDTAFVNDTERFTSVRCSELVVYLKFGDFTALRALLPVLQRELDGIDDILATYYRRYFAYHIGWAHIVLGEPARALAHLNVVLNDRSDVREDLYCFARILNLLVHYELGNTVLLQSEIRSTWRYLAQRQRTYRFETLLLKFIRKAISAQSAKALQREFAVLRQELTALQHDPFESRAFTYFHFIPWLDSRINGVDFAEALREYVQTEIEHAKAASL